MRIAHVGAQFGQRHAQVIDECFESRLGPRRILADQAMHGGERIEQEMRFDLGLQDHQPQIRFRALLVEDREFAGVLAQRPTSAARDERR